MNALKPKSDTVYTLYTVWNLLETGNHYKPFISHLFDPFLNMLMLFGQLLSLIVSNQQALKIKMKLLASW